MNIVKNAKRNVAFGLVNKFTALIVPFIERTLIQYILGSKYLGLSSLFSSILTVLSLSELGLSSAIVYNMYKPVAQKDYAAVNALLNFYRKAYRIIGCVILTIGLVLVPFLPKLVNGETAKSLGINIYVVYLIFLINSSLSYFLYAYLTSVIVVYQREDISSIITSIKEVLLLIARTIVLLLFQSYYLYVLLLPVFTVFTNLFRAKVVKKRFPQIKCEGVVPSEKLASIKKLVAGSFIQKACVVSRNSLDSICISTILGLELTAIYNNYYLIISALTAVLSLLSSSIAGGIGNHVAIKSVDENFKEMKALDFMFLWLAGWFSICLSCLYQPFMEVWMGKDMLLPESIVILLGAYFYILSLGNARFLYTSANGLWWEHRFRSIAECIGNLVLNIVLGKFFGIVGIICATLITILSCNYFWGAAITFRMYFNKDYLKKYFLYQLTYSSVTACLFVLMQFVIRLLPEMPPIPTFLVRGVLCAIIPNSIYLLVYHKTPEFKFQMDRIFRKKKKTAKKAED